MLLARSRLAPRRFLVAASLALLAACAEPTRPVEPVESTVAISATLTPEQQALIAAMSVEVTGPGIATPIVVTLNVAGTTVNGTVRVPAGSARVFTVRAFDAQGQQVGSGSSTANVQAGDNAAVVVQLTIPSPTGDVPVNVTIGSYTITVAPTSVTIARGASTTLTATVTEVGGAVVANPTVQWGARNPVVAGLTSGANGTVTLTGGVAGTTTVTANWRGFAAPVTVTVTP